MTTAPASRFRDVGALESLGERLRRLPVSRGPRAWLKRLYNAALMVRTGGRGLRSELPGGEVVYVSPEYRYVTWNSIEYAAFRDAMQPGAVALDVGANVGAYSLLLAQWAGSSGMVYAFEPAPRAFEGLVGHVRLNGLGATLKPVHAAMSDATGHARFVVSAAAGQGRLAAAADAGEQVVTVPITTIDDFCVSAGLAPAFIKIDVEGHETAVLRGARATLRRLRGRVAVFVEVHPGTWPQIGTSRAELEAELSLQGIALAPLEPMDDWLAVEGMCLRIVWP
jgi:FkbM family methyltransferase